MFNFLHVFKLSCQAFQTGANIKRSWGEGYVCDRTVGGTFLKFRNKNMDLEGQGGIGRSSVINNQNRKTLVEQKPHQIIREMSKIIRVSISTVSNHFDNIGRRKKLGKFVPYELSECLIVRRLEVCSTLYLQKFE